jgi:hypothetical protein
MKQGCGCTDCQKGSTKQPASEGDRIRQLLAELRGR